MIWFSLVFAFFVGGSVIVDLVPDTGDTGHTTDTKNHLNIM